MARKFTSAPIESTPTSKIERVLDLLGQKNGAALDDLIAATGWQPHSARAALSGLRKKGHTIVRSKVDGSTRYAIEAPSE